VCQVRTESVEVVARNVHLGQGKLSEAHGDVIAEENIDDLDRRERSVACQANERHQLGAAMDPDVDRLT
jgi:hypothetical protein